LRELNGTPLTFNNGIPFKRCFAFHASRARFEAIYEKNWYRAEELDEIHDDAWSPNLRERPELKTFIELWRADVGN
jgi:hypothetical protein